MNNASKTVKTVRVIIYNTGKEYKAIIEESINNIRIAAVDNSIESLIDKFYDNFNKFRIIHKLYSNYELEFIYNKSNSGLKNGPVKTVRVDIYYNGEKYTAVYAHPTKSKNYSITNSYLDSLIMNVKHDIVNASELNHNIYELEFVYVIPNMVLKNEHAMLNNSKEVKTSTDNNDSSKVIEIFTLMNQANMTLTEINTLTDKERTDLVKLFTEQNTLTNKERSSLGNIFTELSNDEVNKPSDLSDANNPNDINRAVNKILSSRLSSGNSNTFIALDDLDEYINNQKMWDDVVKKIVKDVNFNNGGKKSININIIDYLTENYTISKK